MHKTVKLIFDNGQTEPFQPEKLIRSLKGKREIYTGKLSGKEVVVKIFTSKLHRARHFTREIKGITDLSTRGIKSVKLIAKGRTDSGEYFIAVEKIENAVDIFSIFDPGDDRDLLGKVQSEVFEYIAMMHQNGVYQEDMHLGNFLWDGADVYGLDVAEMKFYPKPLSQKKSLKQITILLASIPESGWVEKQKLIDKYFVARKWNCAPAIVDKLEKLILRERLKRARKSQRKIFRTSKRFLKVGQDCINGIIDRKFFDGYDINKLIGDFDGIIKNGTVLKDGNTCFVSRIDVAGKNIVVKRYNHKSLFHSLRHTIKSSRAKKCWRFGHRFDTFDISSAKAVAFFERRRFGLIWQSYILNEFIDGVELNTVITSDQYSQQQKDSALKQTRNLLAKLVRFQMSHGDMKLANTMISSGKAVLIDLDSMRSHRCRVIQHYYQKKMIGKFDKRLANPPA